MRSRKDRILEVIFYVVVALVATVSIVGLLLSHTQPIIIQGQIEADEVVVSGKLAGRIARFYVSEGETVTEGDTLVEITSPEALAKYQQAWAIESAARAQSRKIENGTRKELIDAAKQLWQGANAQRQLAEKSFRRIERLWRDSIVSLQRKEESEALYKSAQSAERIAYQEYRLAIRGAQSEDKESARAMVDAAAGVVGQVDAVLQDSHLVAPHGGVVAAIYPQVGELVGTGRPLLSIVDLGKAHAVVMVREDLMPRFTMGSRFVAAVPAIGAEEVEFEVYYIAPLGSYATWRASHNNGSYDMRTFEIHAHPTNQVDGLRAGMSVILTLDNNS